MSRPAFYALERGGWRDWVTLLHLPYTAWHLSYAVVGGCLVASVDWGVLGLTVLAFLLALGLGAHALDELHGRPLETEIPGSVLVVIAATTVVGACAIGVLVALDRTLWLLPLVAVGAFLVVAYNLELAGGRFHSDLWFALAWGAFPVVTAAVAQTGARPVVVALAAAWATFLSLAQRTLSTAARAVRRDVRAVSGRLELHDGSTRPIDRDRLLAAPERALELLAASAVTAAAVLVASHL